MQLFNCAVNEDKIELKSVEDHSGHWHRGLQKHFGSIAYQVV